MAAVSSLVNKKLPIKNFIVIVLLLLVGAIIFKSFSIGSERAKFTTHSVAVAECYRAEILMRLADAIELLPISKLMLQASKKNVDNQAILIEEADDLLEKATAEQSKNIGILCKKIILEFDNGKKIKNALEKLDAISQAQANSAITIKEKNLAELIRYAYDEDKDRSLSSLQPVAQRNAEGILKDTLSDGWYSERALLRIYKIENQNAKCEALNAEIKDKTWRYIFKLAFLSMAGTLLAIFGAVIILYQLVISNTGDNKQNGDNKKTDDDLTVAPVAVVKDWQTVALIFLAWFFTQIFIGFVAGMLKQQGLLSYSSSLSAALSIALIYLLSNGPALLYIYFFALKPNGLKFFDGLRLRLTVSNYGSIALVIVGMLGWVAAMPIVLAAYIISAQFFGASGSSNPVISIVMEAAQSNNIIAIMLFYFTLGVLAPICEEGLFRGFFYTYLRSKHGILFSNLVSSALFSLAHLDAGAALPLFCLGSVFAYLREKTGSIVPSIIAHGLWNSATFTSILILFGKA